jgi:hypothetical protein
MAGGLKGEKVEDCWAVHKAARPAITNVENDMVD